MHELWEAIQEIKLFLQRRKTMKNNIVSILSIISGLFPTIIAIIYYVYISEHLTPAERILLSIKDKFYIYITTVGLALVVFISFTVFTVFTYFIDAYSFLICSIIIINILLLFILVNFMAYHHPINVYLIIDNSQFKLLNKLDSAHISVRPRFGSDNELMIFNISQLENHVLREEYHLKKPKSEDWIVTFIVSLMTSLSTIIIIVSIKNNIYVHDLIITCIVSVISSVFIMYRKKRNT